MLLVKVLCKMIYACVVIINSNTIFSASFLINLLDATLYASDFRI